MKPYAIVFIVGVASAVVGLRDVSAQQASIKGGVSYGTASNTGLAPGAKQRSGFVLGVGVASSGPIGFGIEGLYAQRGYTSTNPGGSPARFAMLGGLMAEARYVYGLSDLTLNTVTSSSSYKPRSLLLLLGLGF